jgi:hypothetical protein
MAAGQDLMEIDELVVVDNLEVIDESQFEIFDNYNICKQALFMTIFVFVFLYLSFYTKSII